MSERPLVLIVDDEPSLSFILKSFLKKIEVDVAEARNGMDALALARQRKPKLVVLDVMLPFMSGWELCQKLKQLCAPDRVYAVMLTAKGGELDEIRSYECGADAFFPKPANFDTVVKHIQQVLDVKSTENPNP